MAVAKCPACGGAMTIEPGARQVACPRCGKTLRVKAPAPAAQTPAPPLRTAAAPPPPPAAKWYLTLDGETQGPFALTQLASMAHAGELVADTPVWKDGCTKWAAASALPQIQALLAPKPSAPPPAPRGKTTLLRRRPRGKADGGTGVEPRALRQPMLFGGATTVTAVALVLLFFLPWFEVSCSGTKMMNPSGFHFVQGKPGPAFEGFKKSMESGTGTMMKGMMEGMAEEMKKSMKEGLKGAPGRPGPAGMPSVPMPALKMGPPRGADMDENMDPESGAIVYAAGLVGLLMVGATGLASGGLRRRGGGVSDGRCFAVVLLTAMMIVGLVWLYVSVMGEIKKDGEALPPIISLGFTAWYYLSGLLCVGLLAFAGLAVIQKD
ncbi:MAG: DUF4339 domain-containing protein [Candidatus Brocadiae bacterium]|nr:DUF4339 domain-containing protein [Candidatus Brocadiia bacterium]